MKKLLIILALLAGTVNAEVWVKQVTLPDGNGYAFWFVQEGEVHCWVMPEWVQLSYFDLAWMTVPQTAVNHSWPSAGAEIAAICADGPIIPRTTGGPLYTINQYLRVAQLSTVPAGIPCGDPVIRFNFLRAVTYNGQVGFAWCQ